MTISIDLFSLLTFTLSMICALFGGVAWIVSRLDHIKTAITDLDKKSVTYSYCSEKRHSCPCVKEVEEIKKEIKERHYKTGDKGER